MTGIARPWYFPIMSSYWLGTRRKSGREMGGYESAPTAIKQDAGHFEPEPPNRQKGIEIRDLRKVYHNGKTAVDGLTLNIYEGITVRFRDIRTTKRGKIIIRMTKLNGKTVENQMKIKKNYQ